MTYADYSKMSREALLKELDTTRRSLFDIRYQVTNKQSKANHEITNLKKAVAQILTALNPSNATKALESEEKVGQNAATKAPKAPRAASPKAKKAAPKAKKA
jgi:ribosomal protein L29